MRRTKTPTKVERLMTALYKTHHAALHAKTYKMVGGAADDLIGQLAEKLLARTDELWDGNDERVFSFLLNALMRLSFNYLRDNKKYTWDCDRNPVFFSNGDTQECRIVEWKAWTDPSSSPETIAIAAISREQIHHLMVEIDQIDHQRVCSYAEIFDLLADDHGGKEIGERLQLNINTAHGAIRRVRQRIERYNQERPQGARGA